MLLADLLIAGRPRKVMIQANKNGFLYVLDRTNCSLIAANPYVKVNWASHVDLETGRPVLTDVYKRFFAGEEVEIWPSRGTNAVPIAFDPASSLVYATTWNVPRLQKIAAPKPQVLGADSTGVTARVPDVHPGDVLGYFAAIDPMTGRRKWEVPLTDLPASAGMLATGGGLVFRGRSWDLDATIERDAGAGGVLYATGTENSGLSVFIQDDRLVLDYNCFGDHHIVESERRVPAGASIWTFALMP